MKDDGGFLDSSESDVVAELVRQSGMSQEKLGEKLGIYQSTISNLIAGKRRLTKAQMIAFSRHFGVPVTVFFPNDCGPSGSGRGR